MAGELCVMRMGTYTKGVGKKTRSMEQLNIDMPTVLSSKVSTSCVRAVHELKPLFKGSYVDGKKQGDGQVQFCDGAQFAGAWDSSGNQDGKFTYANGHSVQFSPKSETPNM